MYTVVRPSAHESEQWENFSGLWQVIHNTYMTRVYNIIVKWPQLPREDGGLTAIPPHQKRCWNSKAVYRSHHPKPVVWTYEIDSTGLTFGGRDTYFESHAVTFYSEEICNSIFRTTMTPFSDVFEFALQTTEHRTVRSLLNRRNNSR